MKRVPEKLILSEDDIKEAIALWLSEEHDLDEDYTIDFKVEHKQEAPKGMRGGMSDWIDVMKITAVVERE